MTWLEACAQLNKFMGDKQIAHWDAYSLKATNDEIVDEALRVLGRSVAA